MKTDANLPTVRKPRKKTFFLLASSKPLKKRGSGSVSRIRNAGYDTVMMILQALKFVSLVHLSAVRRLVDVLDSAEAESGVIAIGSLFHTHH